MSCRVNRKSKLRISHNGGVRHAKKVGIAIAALLALILALPYLISAEKFRLVFLVGMLLVGLQMSRALV